MSAGAVVLKPCGIGGGAVRWRISGAATDKPFTILVFVNSIVGTLGLWSQEVLGDDWCGE